MAGAKFFVCERTGDWALAWRRELATAGLAVSEVRSLENLNEALAAFPYSVAAVATQVATNEALVRWLWESHERWPHARFGLLAAPSQRIFEMAWREAGAMFVACGSLEIAAAVPLVAGHVRRAPQPEQTLAERIAGELPWPRFAASPNVPQPVAGN